MHWRMKEIRFGVKNETVKNKTTITLVLMISGCGMLMMPTITWAMSKFDAKYISDGTAIITSLRTVAGSLGVAVFISIMTVAAQNETTAGQIFGVNIAFAVMYALTAVLFGIAVVKIK